MSLPSIIDRLDVLNVDLENQVASVAQLADILVGQPPAPSAHLGVGDPSPAYSMLSELDGRLDRLQNISDNLRVALGRLVEGVGGDRKVSAIPTAQTKGF